MIIAAFALTLSSILPCVDTTPPHVTFAQPGSPNYVAMTHVRRLPAELCEPLEALPLAGEPMALLDVPALPFTPFLPPEGLYAVPGSPFLWGPMDGAPDEDESGGWVGAIVGVIGGSGGGVAVNVPVVPEPSVWMMLLGGVLLGWWRKRHLGERA